MNPTRLYILAITAVCLLMAPERLFGQSSQSRGITTRSAPAWEVEEWFNLPEGVDSIDIADFKGKVVYLYAFQSWCPGCHSRGFPTLKTLSEQYADADDVAFVAVQTTFEGFSSNTAQRAKEMGERYELDIPIGHSGSNGRRSKLMQAYRTGGTPWTIVIDKQGIVRFNDFHLTPEQGTRMIERLRKQTNPAHEIETLPESRGGQDVVGKRWPKLDLDAEIDRTQAPARPKATLYRWWTTSCPWCEASLPAIEKLRTKYEPAGLRTVAVFHPKPPREVTQQTIIEAADNLGYGGDLALDKDWSELRRFYLDSRKRGATSVSFLVDENGVVRFVHPGPVFYPSDDPEHARENADHELLEAAIKQLLEVDEPEKG